MRIPTLKDSLGRWTGSPRIVGSLEPRHTRRAVVRVANRLDSSLLRKPERYDLQILHRRVSTVWHRDQSLHRIARRDLRRVPWILFYGPNQADWLGANRYFVTQFGRWLSSGLRSSSARSLLHEFLRVYPTTLITFFDIRRLLRRTIEVSESSRPSLRRWQQRCLKFGLLNADQGRSFVERVVSDSDNPDSHLREAGLHAGLERSGFLRSGVREFLQMVTLRQQQRLGPPQLGRLLKVLELNGGLRFGTPAARREIANALLSPYVHGSTGSRTKEQLLSFFLRHFGDPRLRSGSRKWSGISDEILRVVTRWLVERVLEQFLTLIKETALDRHWRYREAFWRAFLTGNLIDDIWFALGSRAKLQLEHIKGYRDETEATADLRGAASDQSVLLLRMPGVTIAEWSHNGSCRFWLDGNGTAPKLYKSQYHRQDFMRGADYVQPHDGSLQGRWQGLIVEWLRTEIGIQLSRSDYFPSWLRGPRRPKRVVW